ncbi:MAG: D-hexose-6-phosphate mutarotase [Alphaproteobacteria bacterium]|nr:D-hexose-6-phosphate mutarotase [Alphaproteobacteria bacterium]
MSDIVEASADGATVRVHRLGATVLSYVRGGRDLLWVSPNATYLAGAAIRGGIPVCWPWFANDRPGTAHGFARTRLWTPLDAPEGCVRMELREDDGTLAQWPHPFRLELTVRVGRALTVTLRHENLSTAEVVCTGALHTYLRVDDLGSARVHGLDGAGYRDKVLQERSVQSGPLAIDREIDRIYAVADPVELHDGRRIVRVEHSGATVVVWNPGPEVAAAKADLGEGAHARFVCVEAAVTGEEVATIAPGAAFELDTTLYGIDDAP